jgi:hypothetical protein
VSDEKPIELSLEDEDALLERASGKALPKGAYNPYDVDPRAVRAPAKAAAAGPAARTDLRKLSEWIKLKREIEDLKTEEERAAQQGQDGARQARSKK